MRTVRIVLATLAVVFFGVIVLLFWYVRGNSFSARTKPGPVESFLAERVFDPSVPSDAKEARNPLSPTPANLAEGRRHYASNCAVCHGYGGRGSTETRENMYPPPTDLSRSADLTDGEIFYIVKNGVRYTGMPGWDIPDDLAWKLVLFVRELPQLTPRDIEAMKAAAPRDPDVPK